MVGVHELEEMDPLSVEQLPASVVHLGTETYVQWQDVYLQPLSRCKVLLIEVEAAKLLVETPLWRRDEGRHLSA